MANWSDPRGPVTAYPAGVGDARASAVDAGLRSYMLKVYNYMASGVLLTGIVAMLFAQTEFAQNLFTQGGALLWVLMLAPLAFVMVMSFGINRISTVGLQGLFWAFATVMGLSMASIFFRFTGGSIAVTFFATSVAFLSLSLYGYTTKRNLTGIGTFLIMGVVGLIVASIANLFIQSSALYFVISAIGVLIFAGLTAYDTQMIKNTYYQVAGTDFMGKAVVMGALNLYLDFVNMFQFLLSFLGNSE
jgi:FtsH-binding integral membrane protein